MSYQIGDVFELNWPINKVSRLGEVEVIPHHIMAGDHGGPEEDDPMIAVAEGFVLEDGRIIMDRNTNYPITHIVWTGWDEEEVVYKVPVTELRALVPSR